MERIERAKQLRDLLGFSLADIKEMLHAEIAKEQIRAEWRKDADADEKAEKIRAARQVIIQQLALLDQKLEGMQTMREALAERLERFDELLRQYAETMAAEAEPRSKP